MLYTESYSYSVSRIVRGCGLEDVSVEVGIYDRDAFRGTREQWSRVFDALQAEWLTATGVRKRSLWAAMKRTPSEYREFAWAVMRGARKYQRYLRKKT